MKFQNIYKSKNEKQAVKEACRISVSILNQLKGFAKIGATPKQLNELAGDLCSQHKVKPSFYGVKGPKNDFPGNLCVCVNDETLHAIPFSTFQFEPGDIVKIDFGIIFEEIYTDHCTTVAFGQLTDNERRLIDTTRLAVETASKQAMVGNRVGDISHALGSIAQMANFNSIRGYSGHGIGPSLHEDPSIPYEGSKGEGVLLEEGMLICVEVQLSLGTGKLRMDKDGWTLRTEDGSKTAMFEHMVLVGKDAEILTRLD